MSKEFIIADTHFSHANVIDFEKRPFNSTEEMDEKLIKAWNDVVGKTDIVYHLGDFCFGGKKKWRYILDNLKGNIVFIKGNHDKSKIVNGMVNEGLLNEVYPLGTVLKRDGLFLNLSHYPLMIGDRFRQYSVHGHIHGESMDTAYHINVGVDNPFTHAITEGQPFGTPICMDKMVDELKRVEAERME